MLAPRPYVTRSDRPAFYCISKGSAFFLGIRDRHLPPGLDRRGVTHETGNNPTLPRLASALTHPGLMDSGRFRGGPDECLYDFGLVAGPRGRVDPSDPEPKT